MVPGPQYTAGQGNLISPMLLRKSRMMNRFANVAAVAMATADAGRNAGTVEPECVGATCLRWNLDDLYPGMDIAGSFKTRL